MGKLKTGQSRQTKIKIINKMKTKKSNQQTFKIKNKMKKIIMLAILISTLTGVLKAQVSSLGFNYQAQIRNAAGVLVPDSAVQLRFTLLPNQFSTTPAWVEMQSATTDHYGIAGVVIGKGTKTGGTYSTFDQVDFSSGNYWVRTEINSSGNYINLGSDEPLQSVPYAKVAGNLTLFPPGFIMPFAGDTTKIPQGWLLCDGHQVSRSQYSGLYNTIADNWGRGNATTTFNLPDLRGQFLRGVSYNSGIDKDTSSTLRTALNVGGNVGNKVGSYQSDAFKTHTHSTSLISIGGGSSGGTAYSGGGYLFQNAASQATGNVNETRPKNAYVNFLIKY